MKPEKQLADQVCRARDLRASLPPSYPKAEQDDIFFVSLSAPCFILYVFFFLEEGEGMTFGSSLVAAEVPARYLLCQAPLLGYSVVLRPGPPGPGRKGGGSKPPHSPPCALFASCRFSLSCFAQLACFFPPKDRTNNNTQNSRFFFFLFFSSFPLFLPASNKVRLFLFSGRHLFRRCRQSAARQSSLGYPSYIK